MAYLPIKIGCIISLTTQTRQMQGVILHVVKLASALDELHTFGTNFKQISFIMPLRIGCKVSLSK